MMLDWSNPLLQIQAVAFITLCIGNFLLFIALLTPAWQVISSFFLFFCLFTIYKKEKG